MTSPLIGVAELRGALRGRKPPVVLDVRWTLGGPAGAAEYAAGRLPGAVYVDLDAVLAGPPGRGGRHPLPDPGGLELALRGAGVRADSEIVVYDGGSMSAAARAWWVLRWAGHSAVRVLDGGLREWLAAGGATTEEVPRPEEGDFRAVPGSMPVLDADAAARLAREGVLLDARSPERYRGESEPVDPVAGRVPGAVNAPAADDLAADGGLVAGELLRARYDRLGVGGGAPVGAYCGSGVTAAQTVLALATIGEEAALYVGSWSEWVADPTRPVETG